MSRSRLVQLGLVLLGVSLWACGAGVGESALSSTAVTATNDADGGVADPGHGGCDHYHP